jgi:hypothetical protein
MVPNREMSEGLSSGGPKTGAQEINENQLVEDVVKRLPPQRIS